MLDILLDFIYPNVCGMCGKLCKDCLCKKCEVLLKDNEINCVQYIKHNHKLDKIYFDECIHMYKYEGIIREKIIEYKFQDKSYLYKTFSKMILKNEKMCGILKKYDIIIPVPIHRKRKKKRGYNQTELIVNFLGKQLNLEICKNVLFKSKNVISQSELNKVDRKNNVKDAFIIKNAVKVNNKKILLFDDVYTTGSTVEVCSRILKEAGASKVGVLTIAKD